MSAKVNCFVKVNAKKSGMIIIFGVCEQMFDHPIKCMHKSSFKGDLLS